MSDIVHHHTAGGMIYRKGEELELLLIKQLRENDEWQWTMPKGHLEAGESEEQAALREVEEEVGLRSSDIETLFSLGHDEYQYDEDGIENYKIVAWFAMKVDSRFSPTLNGEEGFAEHKWLAEVEAIEQIPYTNFREWLRVAIGGIKAEEYPG